jgi:hypothetical protein
VLARDSFERGDGELRSTEENDAQSAGMLSGHPEPEPEGGERKPGRGLGRGLGSSASIRCVSSWPAGDSALLFGDESSPAGRAGSRAARSPHGMRPGQEPGR